MAARAYTTTELVSDIKRRFSIPSNQALFSNDDLIEFMDDEMQTNIVPIILRYREEYFVEKVSAAPDADNNNRIAIPSRAIGGRLRDVNIVTTGGRWVNVPRIDRDNVGSRFNNRQSYGPTSFYVEGNYVYLLPDDTTVTSIQLSYFRRIPQLVKPSLARQITAVDAVTGTITTDTQYPSDWVAGTKVDVFDDVPPFLKRKDSVEILTTPTVYTFTVDPDDAALFSVNDWVALEEQSPIPQIPVEAHSILVQAAGVKVLESMGDQQELGAAQAKYEESLKNFTDLIKDRVQGEPKKIVGTTNITDFTRRRGWRLWW